MTDAGVPTHQETTAASSPSRRTWGLISRAMREFAAVPLLVVAGFVVVAVISIVADQTHVAWIVGPRHAVGHVIGRKAATTTLQAIATGLVTVTSITFSILLLAVQQTASNLSPVVFDQFLRRRTNQVYLGFFVGLALFAYVTMAAVQDGTAPILGAGMAILLTIVALVLLLALVYSTLNQMRPANVIRQIHDRAHRARHREVPLVRRTRREALSEHPVSATYRSTTTGYVVGIDLDRLEAGLARIPSAEIDLQVCVGEHVAYGDAVATVRDDDEADASWLADEVREALLISPQRDLDVDASTGVDELANIAWTAGSTAKQNPETAGEALDALKDLAARWLTDDPDPLVVDGKVLPVVYRDCVPQLVLDSIYAMFVAAHESHQVMVAARTLDACHDLLERAPTAYRERLTADLELASTLLDQMPPAPILSRRGQPGRPTA